MTPPIDVPNLETRIATLERDLASAKRWADSLMERLEVTDDVLRKALDRIYVLECFRQGLEDGARGVETLVIPPSTAS